MTGKPVASKPAAGKPASFDKPGMATITKGGKAGMAAKLGKAKSVKRLPSTGAGEVVGDAGTSETLLVLGALAVIGRAGYGLRRRPVVAVVRRR